MQSSDILRKASPLLPIFRSKSITLLLAYLLLRSNEEPQNISQLARRFGLATSTVHRDVTELEEAGLLLTETFANSKLVRVNEQSPYFPELASLFRKAFGPEQILTGYLSGLKGVKEAYLYGSYAARYQGQPGPQPQDIDLLVVSDGTLDARKISQLSREASQLLGREVNPTVVGIDEWAEPKTGFLRTLHERPLVSLVTSAS
ncbi:MAG TPA: helix-turn-helix domain-containing protein [Gaiellaceae bacterium]|nr:helix-turn-helix domain-containing protein [Gaiellaceae bacterium]